MTSADPKHVEAVLTAASETADDVATEAPPRRDLPDGWSWANGSLPSGGQASVWPVRHVDGRAGVYRQLRTLSAQERQRFRRELSILRERVNQRSVLTLWDWSADSANPWYISERGDRFDRWWKRAKERHRESPALLVDKAVGCVREIAYALAACHVWPSPLSSRPIRATSGAATARTWSAPRVSDIGTPVDRTVRPDTSLS